VHKYFENRLRVTSVQELEELKFGGQAQSKSSCNGEPTRDGDMELQFVII
jgi:hypothetical protein